MVRTTEITALAQVALSTRSRVGQTVLSRAGEQVRFALANNPALTRDVADRLARSGAVRVRQAALRRAGDGDLLNRTARRGGLLAPAALSNPATGVELLEQALATGNRAERYAALINPSTPVELRREVLCTGVADQVIESAASTTLRVARASELALANDWMAEDVGAWSPKMRRGVLALPGLRAEQVQAAANRTNAPAVEAHPAVSGMVLGEHGVAELVMLANPVVDLHLLGREELGLDGARAMATGRAAATEPHILGRLVRRFGIGALSVEELRGWDSRWSGTRIAAAALVEGAAQFAGRVTHAQWSEALGVDGILQEEEDRWVWFAQLAQRGRVPLERLARSAGLLEHA